ncbi:hypothetical protein AWZ03_003510 [Drosophila navojoa]|uniref:Mitochondrial dicarboxylate carrier n=1 Tax=Drosophila navojoa TaxID=7232 RepID=A0A484BPL9_DRONA|nr:mitochondrial dicarboxylate carrier [Drosophila navojoa]TDG50000.1 hypothetical protein AWZ03_003510 [Drosophila navojoa]
MSYNEKRVSRWYFGGLASTLGTIVTHPLDVVKVQMQTQKRIRKQKLSTVGFMHILVKQHGIYSLFKGISASLMRQYTYTMARFGIYAAGTSVVDTHSMTSKVLLSAFSGGAGGLIGAPADLLNVRLQNDVKLPLENRRNYRNVFDGLVRVCQEEGCFSLFNGASFAALRGAFMTVGQIAFYEQTKDILLSAGFPERADTYVFSSIVSAIAATLLTQPIDVAKTRSMNAAPGVYRNLTDVFYKTALEGPMAFYKGSIPALLRLVPHTVLLFVSLEFLRSYFGYLPKEKSA